MRQNKRDLQERSFFKEENLKNFVEMSGTGSYPYSPGDLWGDGHFLQGIRSHSGSPKIHYEPVVTPLFERKPAFIRKVRDLADFIVGTERSTQADAFHLTKKIHGSTSFLRLSSEKIHLRESISRSEELGFHSTGLQRFHVGAWTNRFGVDHDFP